MKRKHPEQDLQRAVARYLSVALGPDVWWTAIGHGGGGKVRGAILKSMGLKAGVPDILILSPHRTEWGRLYGIELKAPGGRLSLEQDLCRIDMLHAGAAGVTVCRSIEAVAQALKSWGIPTRATVKA